MSRVAVVTDTTHYMPRALVEELGLHEVSLYVTFDGSTDREADITDLHDFYTRLSDSTGVPSTSQPSVGDFLAVYEPLLEEGADIVSIHLSAGISGTCATAEQARDQLVEGGIAPERLVILDSATACAGLGMMAIAATSVARSGGSVAEAAEAAQAVRRELKLWFAVDTLEFLKRGGRIGAASAWVGSTLKIKPILTVESEMTPIERVRTSKRAFERMVDYARQRQGSGADAWVVQHIQAPDQAAALAERCKEIFGHDQVFTGEIGPVLAVHTGPGLLGTGGIPGRFLE